MKLPLASVTKNLRKNKWDFWGRNWKTLLKRFLKIMIDIQLCRWDDSAGVQPSKGISWTQLACVCVVLHLRWVLVRSSWCLLWGISMGGSGSSLKTGQMTRGLSYWSKSLDRALVTQMASKGRWGMSACPLAKMPQVCWRVECRCSVVVWPQQTGLWKTENSYLWVN